MSRSQHALPFALLALPLAAASLALAQTGAAPQPKEYEQQVRPVLLATCATCHSAAQQVGGIDFSAPADGASALRLRQLWRRVAIQIEAGSMPPKGSKSLSADARAKLLKWSKAAADYLDPNDPAARDPGPAVLRRLIPREYNRSIQDLFGIRFDVTQEAGIPNPENPTGFDNLAAALTVSPALLEKQFAAAEKVIDHLAKDRRAMDALLSARPGASLSERDAARQIAARLVRRAYRRLARPADLDRLLSVYDAAAKDSGFEAGVRGMLKPLLASPYFLFRIEEDHPATTHISDPELAVRLSYFLWASTPDVQLDELADAGKLSEPATLEAQVRRMLADPKGRALTDGFAEQWLKLDKLDHARPNTDFFPSFNGRLKRAMHDETATFFDKLRVEDRPVVDLLDSDYTYLNGELARHYGISGVNGEDMQRVALKSEFHRGGLLGMGSVLALTSHTFRTSPTLRGKYILDVIFGTPPPPPPPNAAGMLKEEQGKEPKSFREVLAQHAGNPSCSGCHRKLDPLGFALDNYDAVGVWRESTPDRTLDTTGELPTGEKFKGVGELKQVILKRKADFIRNMTGQLLSYALGRELVDSDEWTIRQVAADAEKQGDRFSALILGIVKSVPFQYRRGTASK